MNIRTELENNEECILSKDATLSKNSKGRRYSESQCEIRTVFQRDRDRILHSKAFRRLKHKTQVFISPEGDHYRTRLTHTLDVSQIARTIARALKLNEDLVEAISLGHDLGHTPFGHTGEGVLDKLHPNGFKHNIQSLRVVDLLEHSSSRIGLNLTYEVRDGILNHSGEAIPMTKEAMLVKISDRIAYINHDIDDSIRANIINKKDIPRDCTRILGDSHRERINTMIVDVIENTHKTNKVSMSDEIEFYTDKLRNFMFDKVYLNKSAKKEEGKAKHIIESLFYYYLENYNKLPMEHLQFYDRIGYAENLTKFDIVCDYIAGMTDRYAVNKYKDIFIPKFWEKF